MDRIILFLSFNLPMEPSNGASTKSPVSSMLSHGILEALLHTAFTASGYSTPFTSSLPLYRFCYRLIWLLKLFHEVAVAGGLGTGCEQNVQLRRRDAGLASPKDTFVLFLSEYTLLSYLSLKNESANSGKICLIRSLIIKELLFHLFFQLYLFLNACNSYSSCFKN